MAPAAAAILILCAGWMKRANAQRKILFLRARHAVLLSLRRQAGRRDDLWLLLLLLLLL